MDTVRLVPTRAAGLERLAWFVPRAAGYAAGRNYDCAGEAGVVSRLSPWLRRRVLTEEETIAAVLAVHPVRSVEKFVQEVLWRTYWKGWLELRPVVWSRYRAGLAAAPPAAVTEAAAARTGIHCFDTWARQLAATGYLHNHARMWFASIWCFTLRLPWEWGAEHFRRHLLDGDPASNTLSWRWVAGLHTPGKHYVARAANIAHFTRGRFDPSGQLDEAPAPLRESAPPPPPDPARLRLPVSPASGGRIGLWLHPDDLSPERAPELAALSPVAGWAVYPETGDVGLAPTVATWDRAALADAARRTADRWGIECATGETADPAGAICAWAKAHRLDTVVALRPTVGPWAELADEKLEPALAAQGVRLEWRRRAWDSRLWPHATHGFFRFWSAVSDGLLMGSPRGGATCPDGR